MPVVTTISNQQQSNFVSRSKSSQGQHSAELGSGDQHQQQVSPPSLMIPGGSLATATNPGTLSPSSCSSTIQHVYELIGLLPDLSLSKLDDIIPPERAVTSLQFAAGGAGIGFGVSFRKGTANNTLSTENFAPTSPTKARQQSADSFGMNNNNNQKQRRFSNVAIEMDSTAPSTADSNEKFIDNTANATRALPALKLVQRSLQHEKSTLFATELEMEFSKEYSKATSFFGAGNVQKSKKILDALLKNETYSIFFRNGVSKNNDFRSEDEFEKQYANFVGDEKRCAALFISARTSAQLLYEQCQEEQEICKRDGIYAMRI